MPDRNIFHCEDVNEIMGKLPPSIVRYGIIILFCILLMLIGGSYFIKSPVILKSEICITTLVPPTEIHAHKDGLISFVQLPSDTVKSGDIIAIYQSSINYHDILCAETFLKKLQEGRKPCIEQKHRQLILDDMQENWNNIIKLYSQHPFNLSDKLPYQLEILVSTTINQIQKWKQVQLITSTTNGIISYNRIYTDKYVTKGEHLFSVIPIEQTDIIGYMYVSSKDFRKVTRGQEVNIKLYGFSWIEYGSIKGYVKSVSPMPIEKENNKCYLVYVSLPKGLLTTNGSLLPFTYEMEGTGEIILEDRRLLETIICSF